jgi:hypothetical protein
MALSNDEGHRQIEYSNVTTLAQTKYYFASKLILMRSYRCRKIGTVKRRTEFDERVCIL